MATEVLDDYGNPLMLGNEDSSYWDAIGINPESLSSSSPSSFADMSQWYTDTGEWDTSNYTGKEIQNTAQPGQEGYGWRYFTDGTAISPDGKYYASGSSTPFYDPSNQSGFWGGISKALGTGAANALKSKVMNPDGSINPAAIGTALMALKAIGGGDQTKTNVYQGSIPKLEAVRQQIAYNDPNRRPGEGGRQYFTDTQYVGRGKQGEIDAAKAAATAQATGILSGYTPKAAPVNPWESGAKKMKRPWESSGIAAETTAAASGEDSRFMTPEEKMAELKKAQEISSAVTLPSLGSPSNWIGGEPEIKAAPAVLPARTMTDPNVGPQPIRAADGGLMAMAKGQYLRGPTDGMADKLNTTIDDQQPAKLSHGEFVIPADVVSHLGNGNSDAGADKLYQMMARIRKARTGNPKQGKQINPDKFMPGGLATLHEYYAGGDVKGFDGTTGSTVTTNSTGTTGTTGTTQAQGLAPWVGDYTTNMLAKGEALSNQPYQAYTGPLTAGASNLQQQAFAGISDIAQGGYTPGTFSGGIFDTSAAQKYMNPYIQTALDPQLKEMQRQSDIARLADAGRLTQAGAYGGSRQAIMESEARRNLLEKQGAAIGQGYSTAYDKAMQQYNADQARRMEAERAGEASRQYSADFGLKSTKELADLGAIERGITAEGIAADKAQFEEQRDYPYKAVQYQKDLLTGLPITATANTPNTTQIGEISNQIKGLLALYNTLAQVRGTGG